MNIGELERIRCQLKFNLNHINIPLASVNAMRTITPELNQTAQAFRKLAEPIISSSKKFGEMLNIIDFQFKSVFEKIHIPTVSNEQKEKLRFSFSKWGAYGWTILPDAALGLFAVVPNTQEEANRIVLAHCNKESLLNLWNSTKTIKGVKTKDFEEAIFDFENKKYKSCAMVLLSLIDAKLIRMQRNEDRTEKGKRKSGFGAIKKIEARIEREEDIETKFLLFLSHVNLFSCLKVMFNDGDDFNTQPALPNRNFVNHGMLTRNVRKRDCIQLFLLYYNFLDFFEIINS